MPKRGANVEKNFVSEQPHGLKYEAKKESATTKTVYAAKKKETGFNRRGAMKKSWQKDEINQHQCHSLRKGALLSAAHKNRYL